METLQNLKTLLAKTRIVFIVISDKVPTNEYLKLGVHDVYGIDVKPEVLLKRFEFIKTHFT
ncbi:hypothetical protein JZU68_07625, partial [bacterium]|nr:hypothetical protein [bacterium]